jgi:hypothetical protein
MHIAPRWTVWGFGALVLLGWGLSAVEGRAAVGRAEASFGVSPTGAASYTIPVPVTEGIGGLTPELSIRSAGADARGILGTGMMLGGLSSIAPCRRTIAQDGVASPISLQGADKYCLHGARLRLLSGSYGASGGNQWHVFRSSGSAIASTPIATGIGMVGTSVWLVSDPSGDGLADLGATSTSTGTWQTRAHLGVPGERLAGAADGLGVSVAFTLAPLTDATVHTRSTNAVYPTQDLQRPWWVVKQMTATDGTGSGSTATITYSYEGARRDASGHGLRAGPPPVRLDRLRPPLRSGRDAGWAAARRDPHHRADLVRRELPPAAGPARARPCAVAGDARLRQPRPATRAAATRAPVTR